MSNAQSSFSSLHLHPLLLETIAKEGYIEPTPIQLAAIPLILEGNDLMGCAQTGTGKTAAFVLPLLQKRIGQVWQGKGRRPVKVLILTPTRELAMQVGESVRSLSATIAIRSLVVYGGVSINPQMMRLRGGVDVLVATPGRLLDLAHKNAVDLSRVETLVIDEADRMLDMGFQPDIKRVLQRLPAQRQNLLFSATFSAEVKKLADQFMHQPMLIEVAPPNEPAKSIAQYVHYVNQKQKRELLSYLIGSQQWAQVLVFVKTKHTANFLTEQLKKDGIKAAAIHGDKSQGARNKALADFKNGIIPVLVATDIAARGLDIEELPYVVNYDLPHLQEDYIHRIGRTGRAEHQGKAISFVTAQEVAEWKAIEAMVGQPAEEMVTSGYEMTSHEKNTSKDKSRQSRDTSAKKKPYRRKNHTSH